MGIKPTGLLQLGCRRMLLSVLLLTCGPAWAVLPKTTAATSPAPTKIKVSIVLSSNHAVVSGLSETTLRCAWFCLNGKESSSGVSDCVSYPIAYLAPEEIDHGGAVPPVVPLTPKAFATKQIGWNFTVKPELFNGLVQLQATASYTQFLLQKRGAYGENTEPIHRSVVDPKTGKVSDLVVTQNSSPMPAFSTSETPFFLFASPGKDYKIKLQVGSELAHLTVRCELL